MPDFLADLDPATLNIVLIAGFVGLMAIALLWFLATRGQRQMEDRISRIAKRPRPGEGGPRSATVSLRKTDSSIEQLDKIIKQFLPNPAKLRMRLARTGKDISLGVYVLISLLAAGLGMLIVRHVVGAGLLPSMALGIVIGILVPHFAIGFMIGRRKKKFLSSFPDGLDVLVRGLKAGLPAAESMRIVAREMAGPVAEEFTVITDGLKLGGDFEDVMWNTAHRIDLAEFNFFVITLSIQRETGGNLGETLENLCDMLRKRRMVRLKVKAISSEARASAVIIGSLPFALFGILYVLNREYMTELFTNPTGPYLIGTALGMLSTGVGIMMKLIKFEI